jgi:membrane associated rhomboid family serine protease
MGIYDRDYASERGTRPGLPPLRALSANTWIIIINVAVHVLRAFAFPTRRGLFPYPTDAVFDFGHFSTAKVIYSGHASLEFWRFLTFQFLHADGIMHLGLNMLGLYIFGSMVEAQLGRKRYIAFYLTCGIFGGLLYLILNALGWYFKLQIPALLFQDPSVPLVGASAGVFGVIMACAYIDPDTRIDMIFPPISLRMRTFAYGYLALAVINLFLGGRNAGGDAAHVGGAIAGYFFIRNSHLLRDFFDVLGDSRKAQPRVRRGPRLRLVDDSLDPPGPTEEELNRVLDKIRTHGQESLTPTEQETLRLATRAKRGAPRP